MEKEHTNIAFDNDLQTIVKTICEMGMQTLNILKISYTSFDGEANEQAAQLANEKDRRVNQFDFEVQDLVTKLIALRQPVGIDLRYATASMRIASCLERIGDLAKSNSRRAINSVEELDKKTSETLVDIAQKSVEMTKLAIQAYEQLDNDKAKKIIELDDEVDDLYMQMTSDIQVEMVNDSKIIKPLSQVLFIVKNIERISDYATTIADSVLYITGKRKNV